MRLSVQGLKNLKLGEWLLTDQEDKNVTALACRYKIPVITQRMILVDREQPDLSIKVVKVTRVFPEMIKKERSHEKT
jgi:hypothetical protein